MRLTNILTWSEVEMLFRFGHSLVKRSINRCNKEFRRVPFNVELHKEMNNPSNLHNFGSVDRYCLLYIIS